MKFTNYEAVIMARNWIIENNADRTSNLSMHLNDILYNPLTAGLDHINGYIRRLKKVSVSAAAGFVAVWLSSSWTESGSWMCPSAANCLEIFKAAKKALKKRRPIQERDLYVLAEEA